MQDGFELSVGLTHRDHRVNQELVFATMFKNSVQKYTDIKIRFVRPDIAAVDVRWEMTGATDAHGNPWPGPEGPAEFCDDLIRRKMGNQGDAQPRSIAAVTAIREVNQRKLLIMTTSF
jgi:hypothetical protein